MKKALAITLAAVMVAGSLAGCGSGGSSETTAQTTAAATTAAAKTEAATTAAKTEAAASGETEAAAAETDKEWYGNDDGTPVHIRLWAGVQPEYGYQQLVDNFNAEYADKGIEAEYVMYKNDTSGNMQLETYLSSGGEVDVFVGYGGRPTLLNRIEANLVMDITDYIEAYHFDLDDNFGKVAMADWRFGDNNDRIYGIPTKAEYRPWMFINEDMFKEAGIEIPYDGWTNEEFLAAAEKLTHGEGIDKVYGVQWGFDYTFSAWKGLMQSVMFPYVTYADDTATAVAYDNPIWKEQLEFTKKTIDLGYAIPFEDEVSEGMTLQTTFLQGKAAMTMGISQMRLILDNETYPHDFMTAVVPGPVPSEEYMDGVHNLHAQNNSAGDIISIAQNTPYPDACFEFLYWYVTGGQIPLVTYGGRMPLYNGIDLDQVVELTAAHAGDLLDTQSLRNYAGLDKSLVVNPVSLTYASTEIDDVFKEEVQAYLQGSQDIDTTISNLVTRGNDLIAQAIAAKGE